MNVTTRDTMSAHVKKPTRLHLGMLLCLVTALLIPAAAWAIPGSGEFVALHSDSGREITQLYNIIAKICLAVLIIVEGVLIYTILRFRRRSDDERPVQNHGDMRLEAGWTLAALAAQVYIGAITIDVMYKVETMPENIDMTVEAIAFQWDWRFRYPDHGGLISRDLVVPAHANVKLEVTSEDVIHSIFIPALGVKMDAVPGRFNYWWFRADGPINQVRAPNYATASANPFIYPSTRPDFLQRFPDATERPIAGLEQRVDHLGASRQVEEVSPYAKYNAVEYQGLCTELCGKGHWDMYFRAVVMSQSSFNQWVRDQQTAVREVSGPALYSEQCSTCHGAEGQGGGTFPSLVASAIVAQPDQARDHIQLVLQGRAAMPGFADRLNDAEIAAVVTHERISWGNAGGEVSDEDVAEVRAALGLPPFPAGGAEPIATADLMRDGARLYQSCTTCHGNDGRGLEIVPNLAGNATVLGDEARLVAILDRGQDLPQWPGAKTPVARSMTDYQVAALLTYIRQSWGNEATPVQPVDVTRAREALR
jgi:cytochrome c oxidase subunit II